MEKPSQITITYKDLNSYAFVESFRKLLKANGLGIKTAYELCKISQKLDSEMKIAHELMGKLRAKHFPVAEAKSTEGEAAPEKNEAFEKEVGELMNTTVNLSGRRKVTVDELEKSGLSAADLAAISPILED